MGISALMFEVIYKGLVCSEIDTWCVCVICLRCLGKVECLHRCFFSTSVGVYSYTCIHVYMYACMCLGRQVQLDRWIDGWAETLLEELILTMMQGKLLIEEYTLHHRKDPFLASGMLLDQEVLEALDTQFPDTKIPRLMSLPFDPEVLTSMTRTGKFAMMTGGG